MISRNNKFGQNSSFVADEMYDLVQQEFIKRNELRSASKAGEQAEFDKDIFTKLVDLVKIKSREIMEQIDELFKQRDELIAEQSDGALSKSQYKMLKDFLKNEQKQTEFDKDVFTKLIEKIIVNSREDITFIFKDGTEVKADLGVTV